MSESKYVLQKREARIAPLFVSWSSSDPIKLDWTRICRDFELARNFELSWIIHTLAVVWPIKTKLSVDREQSAKLMNAVKTVLLSQHADGEDSWSVVRLQWRDEMWVLKSNNGVIVYKDMREKKIAESMSIGVSESLIESSVMHTETCLRIPFLTHRHKEEAELYRRILGRYIQSSERGFTVV